MIEPLNKRPVSVQMMVASADSSTQVFAIGGRTESVLSFSSEMMTASMYEPSMAAESSDEEYPNSGIVKKLTVVRETENERFDD